ncbi:MAG: class I SAM-dependent methyltransferase [Lewinella sp.]
MDYLDTNRAHWNQRTAAHLTSDFYDVEGWLSGGECLRPIELDLLPRSLAGKSLLHLQCHFGQDTLSLARRGAKVTGVDLSDRAIGAARELSQRSGLPGRFINCDVYSLPEHLDETFDIVYTTYGTIGWLPDLDAWAGIVSRYLKPGGQFVFVEFHPLAWLWNEERTAIQYGYFSREAIVEEITGSYTDGSESVKGTEISWDHPVSEVINALIDKRLTLRKFEEYDYSPYDCFPDLIEVGENRYHFKQMPGLLPLTYSLDVIKPL